MKVANESNVAPFIIFSDASLKQMSTFYPIDAESMLKIEGVGLNKLVKYGNRFIETISDYVSKNNIKVSNLAKPQKTKTQKQDTRLITYEMYTNGMSIEDIASERGLTRISIENHLIDCLEKGMDLDLTKYVHTEFKTEIEKAINDIGIEKLKPIKEALPEDVSYFDIRYYIAISKSKE